MRGTRVAILAMVFLTIGCASFRSQHRMDLTPFAEDMIAVAGEIQYSLGQARAVRLRQYALGPEVAALASEAHRARQLIRGVIAYSVQIVTLSEAEISGHERAAGLADYLDEVLRPVEKEPRPDLHLSEAEIDTILVAIRRQESFFDAIREAQPIVDEVAYVSGELFGRLKSAMDEVIEGTRGRIEAEYAETLTADRELRREQVFTMNTLRFLKDLHSGDLAARDSLVAREPSLAKAFSKGKSREDEIRAAEERIVLKLRALNEFRAQLQSDLDTYWTKHEELNGLSTAWSSELRRARVAVLAWSRAHARLAAGVTDPAKIDIKGIARSAAGSLAPW